LRTRRSSSATKQAALQAALLAALLAPALCSCAALSTRQSADTVPAGSYQVFAGLDGVAYRDTQQRVTTPTLQAELGLRRGLSENVDVGARIYVQGVEAGVKWRFARGEWAAALAPSVAASRTRDTTLTVDALYLFSHLPLIVGHRVSPTASVNFGPRLMYGYFYPATGGSAHGLSLGGFVNVDRRLGETWHVFPEIVAYRSVVGEVPVPGWIAQLGAGLAKDF
jgi:hypothetical protein